MTPAKTLLTIEFEIEVDLDDPSAATTLIAGAYDRATRAAFLGEGVVSANPRWRMAPTLKLVVSAKRRGRAT